MITDNLKLVSENYIGAVENAIPYICKHSKLTSLDIILNGSTNEWQWESVSTDEAENVDPMMIMFVKHIATNIKKNPALLSFLGVKPDKNGRYPVRASIVGILIDTTLYLKDKYKSDKLDLMQMTTHDTISIDRTLLKANLHDSYIVGRFDLRSCTYYCKW